MIKVQKAVSSPKTDNDFLDMIPRRTNECWLGSLSYEKGVYVCGYRFLVHLDTNGLMIWQLINGRRTVRELIKVLAQDYIRDDSELVFQQTVNYITELERAGLVAWRTRPLFENVSLDD